MEFRTMLRRPGLPISALVAALAIGPLAPGASADFATGDILVNNFLGSNVQQYHADGTLAQTFTGTGQYWEGASLTPGGNLVTTFRDDGNGNSGVDIFSPAGVQIASFNTPQLLVPGDVSVFADGTLAVSDQVGGAVQEYTRAGAFLRTVSLNLGGPFGSTVGSDNILYVAASGGNVIARVAEGGTILAPFALSFAPGDLVRAADGTFYVSGEFDGMVHHLSASGVDLNDFSIGLSGFFTGIALAADGQSLYVTTESSTMVERLSLTGAALPGGFGLSNPENPLFLTVVPAAVPEPSSVAMAAMGLGLAGLASARARARAGR